MRIVKRVIVPAVPREMIAKSLEFISKALIADAKSRFEKAHKFKTAIRTFGDSALEVYIEFFPYRYDFIWKINQDKLGHEVVLDARTPGRWSDALFSMDKKLEKLVDVQWSALLNFFHGYLTALAYHSKKKSAEDHLKKSKHKLKER